MASASDSADERAKQLLASASSLAMPPLAASAAEAVGLSAGAAILGMLLLLLQLLLRLLLRRVQALSLAKTMNAGITCNKFPFHRIDYSLLSLAFFISGHTSQVFRVYVLVHGLRFCVRGVYFCLKASCI